MNDNALTTRQAEFAAEQAAKICRGPLHPSAVIGLWLFNEGHYFEAHEALETAWRAEPGPIRELYQGILQVGVGYYHIQRSNFNGALKLFRSCSKWLAPYPAICRGVNVARLRQDYQRVEAEVIRLGPEHISLFNQGLFQPVEFST